MDRGVNGQPFLWRNDLATLFVMIDIFNPDSTKRCYSVLSMVEDPYVNEETKGEMIGVGCSDPGDSGWEHAYERARKIAEAYMAKN